MSIVNFVKYNNLIPLSLSLLLLSVSGVFAASPTMRDEAAELVYTKDETVLGIDNSYLLDYDLDYFQPTALVTKVEEDEGAYYVSYEFRTVGVKDDIWQDVVREDMLVVPKRFLSSLNLGEHLSKYFDELIQKEEKLLVETKEIETSLGRSARQVATSYGGLVGEFFDPEIRALPGYIPPEPTSLVRPGMTDLDHEESHEQDDGDLYAGGPHEPFVGDAPSIILLGDDPLLVGVGSVYTELGALVDDTESGAAGVSLAIGGTVDTQTPGAYVITYAATDQDGNVTTARRDVIVESIDQGVPEDETPLVEPPVPTETEVESEPEPGPALEAHVSNIVAPTE